MRKRPLCMVCLILLAIQLVRVSFLQNTKDQKPSLAETLISDEKDVICEGTVYKIENKSQSTAIYLKDAVVSCTDQKSKNQIIKEKKILVTIKNNKSGKKIRMKIGQKLNVWGTKQSFHPPRNPGNFNQKSYYQKQGIHVGVLTKAEQVEIVLSEKDKNWIVSRWNSIRNQLDRLKNYWNWKIVSQMGKTHGAMLSAILLGEKSGLDPEMKKLYQKNGLGHLLAISGVKTLKLDIPLVPETRIKWALMPLHIAKIYILKLCLDEEIIPRCRFPCSRGYLTKCINQQKKQ